MGTSLRNPYGAETLSQSRFDAEEAQSADLINPQEMMMSDLIFLALGLLAFGSFAAYARLLQRL
jgi:hypothetical protein